VAYGSNRTVNIGGAAADVTWSDFTSSANKLILNDSTATGTLTLANGIVLNGTAGSRIISVGNGSAEVDAILAGGISGGFGLTLEGGGTVRMDDSNTYTGPTAINEVGTTLLLGSTGSTSTSSAVTVANGATLGGTGTAAGAVTINGTLAPGLSVGTLNTGSLTLAATSTFDIELGRSGITPVSDRANVTGTVSITSGADLKLTLYTGLNTPVVNDIFFLISNDGADAITGVFTSLNGVTTTLSEGSDFSWNSQQWRITYQADFGSSSFTGGNDLALLVIPEPSTWVLLAFGVALALVARKRGFRASRITS
jgi:fibronectin-binding autotransporter adhesin